jgi:GTPase
MLMGRSLRFLDPMLLRLKSSEKCYLVGLEDKSKSEHLDDTKFTMEESLTELSELAGAAGMSVVGSTYQRLERPNIEYYVGPGKVKEIAKTIMKLKCNSVVFDTELSPSQQKNLEISFRQQMSASSGGSRGSSAAVGKGVKILDRTALILDIFAQHARTREGQLQVQLALMTYRLPRLTNMWTHLERQSAGARGRSNGGVGLRGPGEMQLESDKREMKAKISRLKESIDAVRRTRSSHRKRRRRLGVPVIALVGYTNAGKSSVLNYLTNSGVLVADMLFATLDPTTRIVRLPGVKIPEILLTDTVGFVQKLPTNLVAAFRATLEEIAEADILIHVTDVTNEARRKQEAAVLRELVDMGLVNTPIITIWNKIDMIPKLKEYYKFEAKKRGQTVAFSAITGEGIDEFTAALQSAIFSELVPAEISLLYTEVHILSVLHRIGVVDTVSTVILFRSSHNKFSLLFLRWSILTRIYQ